MRGVSRLAIRPERLGSFRSGMPRRAPAARSRTTSLSRLLRGEIKIKTHQTSQRKIRVTLDGIRVEHIIMCRMMAEEELAAKRRTALAGSESLPFLFPRSVSVSNKKLIHNHNGVEGEDTASGSAPSVSKCTGCHHSPTNIVGRSLKCCNAIPTSKRSETQHTVAKLQ